MQNGQEAKVHYVRSGLPLRIEEHFDGYENLDSDFVLAQALQDQVSKLSLSMVAFLFPSTVSKLSLSTVAFLFPSTRLFFIFLYISFFNLIVNINDYDQCLYMNCLVLLVDGGVVTSSNFDTTDYLICSQE